MKKIIAVAVVAMMMFALATSAFALLPTATAGYKNPPVYIDSLVVSDAYMTGLTTQNWSGSLTNQAYAANAYIWFIAKIGVSAYDDTAAYYYWDGFGKDSATLTFTSKDNCLDFTSANNARISKIWGQNVITQTINTNINVVSTSANTAKFYFDPINLSVLADVQNDKLVSMDQYGAVSFANNLSELIIDPVLPASAFALDKSDNYKLIYGTGAASDDTFSRKTTGSSYYLHFMAITKEATEGLCIGTMKVNGQDEFERDGILDYATSSDYINSVPWYKADSITGTANGTKLYPGDSSKPYPLFNTVNGFEYAVGKINAKAVYPDTAAPWGNEGSIYLVMNDNCDKLVIGFVVNDGVFKGLVTWDKDYYAMGATVVASDTNAYADATYTYNYGKVGAFNYMTNPRTWDAASYKPISSNDLSTIVSLISSYGNTSISTAALQYIFDFFGFSYSSPRAPGDADMLARSGLVTVAEAKYNVANATVTVPDNTIVIPKTGDSATSTGLILVASAILAAAAVGFVLSKRAHN